MLANQFNAVMDECCAGFLETGAGFAFYFGRDLPKVPVLVPYEGTVLRPREGELPELTKKLLREHWKRVTLKAENPGWKKKQVYTEYHARAGGKCGTPASIDKVHDWLKELSAS